MQGNHLELESVINVLYSHAKSLNGHSFWDYIKVEKDLLLESHYPRPSLEL
jgi:hypothetical protein